MQINHGIHCLNSALQGRSFLESEKVFDLSILNGENSYFNQKAIKVNIAIMYHTSDMSCQKINALGDFCVFSLGSRKPGFGSVKSCMN